MCVVGFRLRAIRGRVRGGMKWIVEFVVVDAAILLRPPPPFKSYPSVVACACSCMIGFSHTGYGLSNWRLSVMNSYVARGSLETQKI